jgi:dTDP-4-amino-4,6-dideoxy-D-galactose acyltransferase
VSGRQADAAARIGWAPCAWDSSFFGVAIARITPDRQTAADLAVAVRTAEQSSIDCLYLLAESDDAETVGAAEANGFRLVDVRLTLECVMGADGRGASRERDALAGGTASSPDAARVVRPARLEDLPQLTSLARASHRNTRFYQDTRFDPARSDELYARWIERSVRGELADAVWVVDVDDAPRGYLTIGARDDAATIGLVAVDAACRGRGYGEELLRTALRWTADRGMPRVSVVTQGRSAGAVRFYERAGFTASRIQLWYHRWRQ